jgi:FixJ family two-component response regulator
MQEAELPPEGLISIIDDGEDFREAIAVLMKSRGFTARGLPIRVGFFSPESSQCDRIEFRSSQPA